MIRSTSPVLTRAAALTRPATSWCSAQAAMDIAPREWPTMTARSPAGDRVARTASTSSPKRAQRVVTGSGRPAGAVAPEIDRR